MNSDRIQGNWTQLTGKYREKWGKLTDVDLEVITGKREQFLEKLHEKYGLKREAPETELDDYLSKW